MDRKYRVGVIGATGMVGQRALTLMDGHPWFEVTAVAASPSSAGMRYEDAVAGRWAMTTDIPQGVRDMIVLDAADTKRVSALCDFVFCAVAMDKKLTREMEESYARAERPVMSCNSACRMFSDVPMIIPEINASHDGLIFAQRKRLGTKTGFIAVKPNCSIQSYVPALTPLLKFKPTKVSVCTYQAISGAGKTFKSWPDMIDNVNPFIPGEEEKSEQEPLKIWGTLNAAGDAVDYAQTPVISAQCLRVPVTDGHMAAVSVSFEQKPSEEEILAAWAGYETLPQALSLPLAPKPFVRYMDAPDRPQTRLDREFERGMGVSVGRLRGDKLFDYRFVCLSHNTLRGAAGGMVLAAEYFCKQGFIPYAD